MTSKHAFVEDLKARLDKLDNELSQLEAKAQLARADARVQAEAKLAQVRQMRDQAKQKASELQAASDNAWEHLKQGAEDAWKILKDAFEKAKSEFV